MFGTLSTTLVDFADVGLSQAIIKQLRLQTGRTEVLRIINRSFISSSG